MARLCENSDPCFKAQFQLLSELLLIGATSPPFPPLATAHLPPSLLAVNSTVSLSRVGKQVPVFFTRTDKSRGQPNIRRNKISKQERWVARSLSVFSQRLKGHLWEYCGTERGRRTFKKATGLSVYGRSTRLSTLCTPSNVLLLLSRCQIGSH